MRRYGVLLWTGTSPAVNSGALPLSMLSGGSPLTLWRLALTVLGLLPFAAALRLALAGSSTSDSGEA
jgi:hypothetical protein